MMRTTVFLGLLLAGVALAASVWWAAGRVAQPQNDDSVDILSDPSTQRGSEATAIAEPVIPESGRPGEEGGRVEEQAVVTPPREPLDLTVPQLTWPDSIAEPGAAEEKSYQFPDLFEKQESEGKTHWGGKLLLEKTTEEDAAFVDSIDGLEVRVERKLD